MTDTKNTISLRPVQSADLDAIHAMNEEAVPHVNSVSPDMISWFSTTAPYFRVAEVAGAVAAYLIGLTPEVEYDSLNFKWFKVKYPSFVYVDRIVVGEAWRRRSIASKLYADIETFSLGRAPVLTCEVNTRPQNEVSLAFHRHHGFVEVGTQDTEGGTKSVVLLSKDMSTVAVGKN